MLLFNSKEKIIERLLFWTILLICLFILHHSARAMPNANLKIELNFFPETNNINILLANLGGSPIRLYNSDLRSKNYSTVPIGLMIKLKNGTNTIISKNVFGADRDGFITSKVFESQLLELPVSPISIKANETIGVEIPLKILIGGFEGHIPNLMEVKYIKLRYSVYFDEFLKEKVTYTTDWLPYENDK